MRRGHHRPLSSQHGQRSLSEPELGFALTHRIVADRGPGIDTTYFFKDS